MNSTLETTARRRLSRCGMVCSFSVALAGCNALLDIEEAHVDPRLSPTTVDASTSSTPTATETDTTDPREAGASETAEPNHDASTEPSTEDVTEPDTESDLEPTDMGDPCLVNDASAAAECDTLATSTSPEPTQHETQTTDPPDAAVQRPTDSGSAEHTHAPEPPDAGTEEDEDAATGNTVCEKYCADITELCTDELEQYRDMAQCLKICSLLPEGELASEENENTAACRLRYAAKARYAAGTELAAYCRQAGPGGDGRCGSNCEGYCSVMMNVCTEDEAAIYHYEDEEACLETCNALPVSPAGYSTQTEISDGNHVQCRLFHVTSAAMLDAEEHCEHAMGLTLCEAVEEAP